MTENHDEDEQEQQKLLIRRAVEPRGNVDRLPARFDVLRGVAGLHGGRYAARDVRGRFKGGAVGPRPRRDLQMG